MRYKIEPVASRRYLDNFINIPNIQLILSANYISFLCRFRAIVCSLKKPLTFREVKMCITFIWIISGGIFCTELYRTTVFLNPHVLNNDNWYICSIDYRPEGTWSIDDAKRDAIIKFFIVYAVPLLIMMMLYSAIMFFMWKRTSPGEMSDVHQV